jgi:hypothetical protein
VNLDWIADITLDQHGLGQRGCHGFGVLFVLSGVIRNVINNTARATFAKCSDDACANASRTPGDQGYLAGEVEWFGHA